MSPAGPRATLIAVFALLAGASPAGPALGAPLSFEGAVSLALERNERAAAADERAAAARARLEKARSFFFPHLEARGDYTRRAYESTRVVEGDEVTIQSRDALEARATLSQVLLSPRAFPAYRQARYASDAAQFSAREDRRQLAFEAAEAFLATLGAVQVRDAAEQRRELARRSLADAQARFDAGIAGSNDVTRAQLELATAERAATRAASLADLTQLHLGFLLDEEDPGPLEDPIRLFTDATAPLAVDSASSPAAADARRLDLLAARRDAASLHASRDAARYRILPELGFSGEYSMTNEPGLSDRDSDWSLGLGLVWQAYDGGEADLGVRETERRVALEIQSALVTLAGEQASLDQAGAAAEAAKRNAEEAAELYRRGLASALETLDANVRLFEADVDLVRARLGLGLAFLDTRAANGLDPLGREPAP